jgi:putative drug exporter of the RND superfamily
LARNLFESLNKFIVKRHRWIIIAWVIALVVSLSLVPSFFSSVSYNIVGGFSAPSNSQSEKASDILKEQFSSPSNQNSNSGSSSIILLVVQDVQPYSDALKKAILNLNHTITNDPGITNFTGESSLYSTEYSLLNSSIPSILPQVDALQANINSINTGVYTLKGNLSFLSSNLFQTIEGINQTAQLVYGIPAAFVGAWQGITSQGVSDPYLANLQANATAYQLTGNFGGDPNSIGYYTAFFNVWNSSFLSLPSNAVSVTDRESLAINQSVALFLSSPQLDSQTKQIVTAVASGLTVSNWSQSDTVTNLAKSTLAANIPSGLSNQLGITTQALINQLYSLGSSPSNATILNFAKNLTLNSLGNLTNVDVGFSPSQLVNEAVNLGSSPSFAQRWALASEFIANATQTTFVGSPLFSISSPTLANLLSSLPQNATTTQIEGSIQNIITNQSYPDFPYQPTSAITKNFVGADNNTVLVILGFSSDPDVKSIAQLKLDIQSSGLHNLGTVYVTGSSVLSKDVEAAFAPALELTVGPGILISLLIVGILFLAPLATIIPVILGGVSTVISLASIYFAVVTIGKGTITFLTPTLTILLLLGLAVDYAVLQLRRTREERQQGKSVEESVGLSVRWAGQAVLTAGITVIVAYIVMAVVNVPIFSDVGTAIAISVSILLAASLTLLPALEIALKDKIFWPGLGRTKNGSNSPRLRNLAKNILKRKKVITIIISALALGAFYFEYTTPTGSDFLKLIPNFPSNHGLTVISNSFGSAFIAPTTIVVTTPTPIVDGDNQFNQTLMDQMETIAQAVVNSPDVVSITSPTRPFGSAFNYSELTNMSDTLRPQYESQIYSMIGNDNKTVKFTVGFSIEAQSQAAITALEQTKKNVDSLALVDGVIATFGGETQSSMDSQAFMANLLPEVVIILAVAVYVILFVQLRSAFTPLRLIFTILCSVAFALAILSAVFYYASNLPILNFAPLFVVVTMLGVGIDYDIFFVTRMREEALKGNSDDEAIKTAVEKVWVTILGLGLVLATVFASLLITGIAILQEIALAVSAAIIIDVLVIILFFVPSLMGLAEKLNWWPNKSSKTLPQEN